MDSDWHWQAGTEGKISQVDRSLFLSPSLSLSLVRAGNEEPSALTLLTRRPPRPAHSPVHCVSVRGLPLQWKLVWSSFYKMRVKHRKHEMYSDVQK